MARITFEKIMAGLEDALAYADHNVSCGEAVNLVSTKSTNDTNVKPGDLIKETKNKHKRVTNV
jgi:hypothetical protein